MARLERLTITGVVLVAGFAIAAIAAPVIPAHDPGAIDAARRLEGPTQGHLLGTDNLGRDMLSRIMHGSRYSLGAVALSTVLITSIGVLVGTLAGYYGGRMDDVLMRIVDTLLAFPSLLLALAIAGTIGPGLTSVIAGIVAVWWAGYARVVRGMVQSYRNADFVMSARSLGAADGRIILRHVLPNVMPSVAILATIEMGELILAVAGLGFLGLGAQSPTPEWGTMVSDARPFLMSAPQLMIYPGVAISAVVIGFNLIGDGLRDLLDPRLRAAIAKR